MSANTRLSTNRGVSVSSIVGKQSQPWDRPVCLIAQMTNPRTAPSAKRARWVATRDEWKQSCWWSCKRFGLPDRRLVSNPSQKVSEVLLPYFDCI
mgnify:CR=1 FL=1